MTPDEYAILVAAGVESKAAGERSPADPLTGSRATPVRPELLRMPAPQPLAVRLATGRP